MNRLSNADAVRKHQRTFVGVEEHFRDAGMHIFREGQGIPCAGLR